MVARMPAMELLANSPAIAESIREGLAEHLRVEALIEECAAAPKHAEHIQAYDPRTCQTKVLLLQDHVCNPDFFRCAMFKIGEFELARREANKLIYQLDALAPQDRGDAVWSIYRWIARAYDATNVASSFRMPLGRWVDPGNTPISPARTGPPLRAVAAPEDFGFDDDHPLLEHLGITAELYHQRWVAARTSAAAITRPGADAWMGLHATGEWLERQLVQAQATHGVPAEMVQIPAVFADGLSKEWGTKKHAYLSWDTRFTPRWTQESYASLGRDPLPHYTHPLQGLARSVDKDAVARAEFNYLWRGIRSDGVQGTRSEEYRRRSYAGSDPIIPRRKKTRKLDRYFMGWSTHEELARRLVDHLNATSFEEFILSGLYNWVVQTDILVNLGILTLEDWETTKDNWQAGVLKDASTIGELFGSLGVIGKIFGVILYIFAWIIVKPSRPAIGGANCLRAPFIRMPTNADCQVGGIDDRSEQERWMTDVRNQLLPQIEAHTGLRVDQFRVPEDVTGGGGPVTKASPMFALLAILGGAGAAYAVNR